MAEEAIDASSASQETADMEQSKSADLRSWTESQLQQFADEVAGDRAKLSGVRACNRLAQDLLIPK